MAKKKKSKAGDGGFMDFLIRHRRIVMPAVLIVCVLATVMLALHLNRVREEAESAEETSEADPATSFEAMTVCENEAIIDLVRRYYTACADGDMETLAQTTRDLPEMERLLQEELSRHVEYYDVQEIYLKAGPEENSYIVYVVAPYKYYDHEKTVPSMESLLVMQDEDSSYYIYAGEITDDQYVFLRSSNFADDVVDLNNRIISDFNLIRETDPDLWELHSAINKSVSAKVDEALAQEANAIARQEEEQRSRQTGDMLRARQPANVRSSMNMSDDTNIIGKVDQGQTFSRISVESDGWSRIEYTGEDGQTYPEAYVRSEYFDVLGPDGTVEDTSGILPGMHNVNTGCNIRKEPNTQSEVLGEIIVGTSVEVTGTESGESVNGTGIWCKIRHGGVEGYILSSFVDP